jgi:hypothetical protein
MTTYTLQLSTDSTNYVKKLPIIEFDDRSLLQVSFGDMDESSMPIYIEINWGDGSSEYYDNNIIQNNSTFINSFDKSPIFLETYAHEYFPSNTSLYKSLTGQILIKYTNSDQSWFMFPLKIRTYDYYESIYDMTLLNTNILPIENNSKQYQLLTDVDRYVVELRND